MTTSFDFKRGDSFDIEGQVAVDGTVQDITNWGIRSHLRNGTTLIAALTVTKTDATDGKYTLSVADTTAWPLRRLVCDIEYTRPDGKIASTETFYINCIQDVTHD